MSSDLLVYLITSGDIYDINDDVSSGVWSLMYYYIYYKSNMRNKKAVLSTMVKGGLLANI